MAAAPKGASRPWRPPSRSAAAAAPRPHPSPRSALDRPSSVQRDAQARALASPGSWRGTAARAVAAVRARDHPQRERDVGDRRASAPTCVRGSPSPPICPSSSIDAGHRHPSAVGLIPASPQSAPAADAGARVGPEPAPRPAATVAASPPLLPPGVRAGRTGWGGRRPVVGLDPSAPRRAVRLPEQDRARCLEPRDGVASARAASRARSDADRHRQPGGRDVVLDGERDAVQRAERLAACQRRVRSAARARARPRASSTTTPLIALVDRFDPVQVRAGDLDRQTARSRTIRASATAGSPVSPDWPIPAEGNTRRRLTAGAAGATLRGCIRPGGGSPAGRWRCSRSANAGIVLALWWRAAGAGDLDGTAAVLAELSRVTGLLGAYLVLVELLLLARLPVLDRVGGLRPPDGLAPLERARVRDAAERPRRPDHGRVRARGPDLRARGGQAPGDRLSGRDHRDRGARRADRRRRQLGRGDAPPAALRDVVLRAPLRLPRRRARDSATSSRPARRSSASPRRGPTGTACTARRSRRSAASASSSRSRAACATGSAWCAWSRRRRAWCRSRSAASGSTGCGSARASSSARFLRATAGSRPASRTGIASRWTGVGSS